MSKYRNSNICTEIAKLKKRIKSLEGGTSEDCATQEYVQSAIEDALQQTLKIDDIKLSNGYIAYYEQ